MEGQKHGQGEEVGVEEVFVPVFAVFGVDILDVDTHKGGKDLSYQEYY